MSATLLPGGWIYVLLTSQDYTRCKIGRTSGNPLIRFRQLRTADPFLGMGVAYYIPNSVGDTLEFEAAIHNEFKDQRLQSHDDGRTEWFRIKYSQAEMMIDVMLEGWCNQKLNYFGALHSDKLCKLYESDILACFEPDPHETNWLDGP